MPTITIGGSAPSPEQAAAIRAALGIPDADVITTALSPLVSTDQLIVTRAGTSYTGTLTALATYIADEFSLTPPAATAPAAFSSGQWTLTAIAGGLRFGITTLPSDGGSAITDLEYSTNNGGAWSSFGAATTGNYDVTGLSEIEYSCMVRAVNAVGNGANSDMKAETPAAAGGGGGTAVYVQRAREFNAFGNTQTVTFGAAMTAGNAVVACVIVPNGTSITSVVGSDTVSLGTALYSIALTDQTHVYYALANATALTSVTVTLGSNVSFDTIVYEWSGLGTTLSLDDSDSGTYGSATGTWQFPVTTTVTNTAFMCNVNVTLDAWPVGVSPVTAFPGSSDYSIGGYAVLASTGAQTPEITMTTNGSTGTTRAGDRSWIVIRAGA